jgi:hypothetical protein
MEIGTRQAWSLCLRGKDSLSIGARTVAEEPALRRSLPHPRLSAPLIMIGSQPS